MKIEINRINHENLIAYMRRWKLYHTNHESKNYFECDSYGRYRIRHKDKVFLDTKDSLEAVAKYNELEKLFYDTYGTKEFDKIFK